MKINGSNRDIQESKKSIRASIQKKRDSLSERLRQQKSLLISRKFMELDHYKRASKILAYYPFRSEIDTRIIIEDALSRSKEIALPRVSNNRLVLYYIKDLTQDLEFGSYNIMEPIPYSCQQVPINDLELALVPGIGFDRDHNRLGYGGGFYDRLLLDGAEHIPRISLAFDVQIIDNIPVSEYDLKIDILITESYFY